MPFSSMKSNTNALLQVETVGDKYMAVSGLPEVCKEHAKCIASLALDMIDISKDLKFPDGHPVAVRR